MNIYITLDYELYMNDRTGDVKNCLIIPTNELLSILHRQGVKATFFVDAAYLLRLNELKDTYTALYNDFELISEQLKTICQQGHCLGLHLHPQWKYSQYDGKKWKVDFSHYKLSDMEQEYADALFRDGKELLEQLSNRKITSFRAGGYSIQDYRSFPDILKQTSITHDSSVRYGMKNLTHLQYYDYTHVKDSDEYRFSTDITIIDNSGSFVEHPISTKRFFYLSYCLGRIQLKGMACNHNWGNGGANPKKKRKMFLNNVLKNTRMTVTVPATIDYESFIFLPRIFKYYENKLKRDFVIIGHPKNFSPVSLAMLDEFIATTKRNNHYCVIANH